MIPIRLTIQRVRKLSLTADGIDRGHFLRGLLVFMGVGQPEGTLTASGADLKHHPTTHASIEKAADKVLQLRLFQEHETLPGEPTKPMQASVLDIEGGIAIVSQFTLWADLRKGNRPGFARALEPKLAQQIYLSFVDAVQKRTGAQTTVVTGVFGSDMQITATQDGPVTFVFDIRDGKIRDL